MKLTNEQFTEILKDSAKFSNFCQKFKMEWWSNDLNPYLTENILDNICLIVWDILKQS